jgi:hypothetical protein
MVEKPVSGLFGVSVVAVLSVVIVVLPLMSSTVGELASTTTGQTEHTNTPAVGCSMQGIRAIRRNRSKICLLSCEPSFFVFYSFVYLFFYSNMIIIIMTPQCYSWKVFPDTTAFTMPTLTTKSPKCSAGCFSLAYLCNTARSAVIISFSLAASRYNLFSLCPAKPAPRYLTIIKVEC